MMVAFFHRRNTTIIALAVLVRPSHHLSTWVATVVEAKEVEQEDWPINQGR
jgi:hypothetical protein